ncbi:MAG TPA: SNF2-related protein [Saprospiraceae bacterium]|nr:SNF2-related protein [Saprospiraceae bacterium]
MPVTEPIYKLLDKDLVKSLQEKHYSASESEVNKILNKNGGKIELRRQINDYFTFTVKDQENEIIILRAGKTEYSINCTCQNFQSKSTCAHIASVLNSIENQFEKAEENEKLIIENQAKQKTDLLSDDILANKEIFIIQGGGRFNSRFIFEEFPIIRNVAVPRKLNAQKIDQGIRLTFDGKPRKIQTDFVVNKKNDLEITCSCRILSTHAMCQHSSMGLRYFINSYYANPFEEFINRDEEKAAILKEYGLDINDPEAAQFKFGQDYGGKLTVISAPDYIVSSANIPLLKSKLVVKPKEIIKKQRTFTQVDSHEIGFYFIFSHLKTENNPVKIEAFKKEKNKKGGEKLSKLSLSNEENLSQFSVLSQERFNALMDFSFIKFKNEISFDSYYTLNYNNFQKYYNEKTKLSYIKYFFTKLYENWDILSEWEDIKFLPEKETFHQSNLFNLTLSPDRLITSIVTQQNDRFVMLNLIFKTKEGETIDPGSEIDIYQGRLIKIDHRLYIHDNEEMIPMLESMPKGKLYFPIKQKLTVMKEILLPLKQKYNIALPDDLEMKIKDVQMTPALHFREFQNSFLFLEPKFYYGDYILDQASSSELFVEEDGINYLISRNKEVEEEFSEYIKSLHPNFRNQVYTPYYQLPFEEVMKNNWFINVSKQLMDQDIKLVGVKELKRFKYNTSTPSWNMSISSGIDWFDVNVTAQWGDEILPFKDIKKAILNNQSFVVLGDGSFGAIPEEWIKKYTFLFKIAKEDKDGIQVSKKHFGIIDLLFSQIDDEEVRAEIEEKKTKLLNIENVKTTTIPKEINATLRPYQESGYQWMQVLDEISWGGCLADDMGLGKTLQTITFLQYLKNKYKNPTSLIICPTSLIFNWESELKKFAPKLKYHIFYGLGRTFDDGHYEDFDIIITSYGTARNDIESLMSFQWEYIILDESQAIKNPDANTTKAMQLLKSRNKLILSGTPLQNNTFDLYAQFNFLNPGLLGSRDFFRNEFANPIDKNNDKEASQTLRTMIKPFMLRRTKSEVAVDLPEKTETILWCQMDKAQKSMYDEYKDYYRHALTQKIEEEGMAKSGMYILEGLLRLRQICDDPRLVKDKEKKPFKGVKIQELVREITENTGDHKMLVFSQFTEMLALIREELDENKIKYCYLDGSTSAANRKAQVELFQSSPEIKVFLISLKAGGVGLNLTEADYVYIVDPWWNPAVEQQAIDRTHRIGQKNNIFAYKMICKDSVEEKILLLQEKKLGISKELITEDGAFFKKLTKDDINFLFS